MNKLNDVNATIVIDSTLVPGADVEQRIRDCILIYAEEVIKKKITIRQCLKCMKIFDEFEWINHEGIVFFVLDADKMKEYKCPHCHETLIKQFGTEPDFIELRFEW